MNSSLLFNRLVLALCGCVWLGLTACGDAPANPGAGSGAAAGKALRIYSFRNRVQDQTLFRSYEARANRPVEVIELGFEQLLAEADRNGLAGGDLVILPTLNQLKILQDRGLLQPFHADIFDKEVSSRFVDTEGYWSALTRWTMAYVYRKDRVDPNVVKKYVDIAMPNLRGRVAISPPDSSGLTELVAAIQAARGSQAAQVWMQNLAANLAFPPTGNDINQIQAVVAGQADVALVSVSAFLRYKYSGQPGAFQAAAALGFELPYDEGDVNYYTVAPIAMLRNAPHRDFALAMIEWLSVRDHQDVWAEAAMEYPINAYSLPSEFLTDINRLPDGPLPPHAYDNNLATARSLIRQFLP